MMNHHPKKDKTKLTYLTHSPDNSGYGMNVAFSSDDDKYNPSYFISGGWYNSEIGNYPAYGQDNLNTEGEQFNSWGHYSAMIWPTTQKIGCGIAHCGDKDSGFPIHAGCVYWPAGK